MLPPATLYASCRVEEGAMSSSIEHTHEAARISIPAVRKICFSPDPMNPHKSRSGRVLTMNSSKYPAEPSVFWVIGPRVVCLYQQHIIALSEQWAQHGPVDLDIVDFRLRQRPGAVCAVLLRGRSRHPATSCHDGMRSVFDRCLRLVRDGLDGWAASGLLNGVSFNNSA